MVRDELEKLFNMYPNHPDMELVNKYLNGIYTNKYKADTYFEPDDNEIYDCVQAVYTTDPNSEDMITAVHALGNIMVKEYNMLMDNVSGRDKFYAKKMRRSYFAGMSALKDAAWIVVHAYAMNAFLNVNEIAELIPVDFPGLSGIWNSHILSMNDVSPKIAAIFMINSDGSCDFINGIKASDVPSPDDVIIHDPKSEHPEDDKPNDKDPKDDYIDKMAEEEAANQKEDEKEKSVADSIADSINSVVDKANKVAKAVSEVLSVAGGPLTANNKKKFTEKGDVASSEVHVVDADEKDIKPVEEGVPFDENNSAPTETTMASEEPVDVEEVVNQVAEEEAKDNTGKLKVNTSNVYTFGSLKKSPEQGTEEVVSGDNTIDDIVGVKIDPDIDVLDPKNNPLIDNNVAWENAFPMIKPFTNLIHRAGLFVGYAECANYPGLLVAVLYDNTGESTGMLCIDPCLIYGDTYRIITIERNDANIFKEIYLAKSQPGLIMKLLTNKGLDKADKDLVQSKLPRAIYDVLYHFDLRYLGVKYEGKMNFLQWRSAVTNMSKLLANMPDIRLRILEFENSNHFKLVCDEKVLAVMNLPVLNSPDQYKYAGKRLTIEYNTEFEKELGEGKLWKMWYEVNPENAPLDFDPYRVLPEKKKRDKKKPHNNTEPATTEAAPAPQQ